MIKWLWHKTLRKSKFNDQKTGEAYLKNGPQINLEKTDYLVTTENAVKTLDKFKYIGFPISINGTTEEEIKKTIGKSNNMY